MAINIISPIYVFTISFMFRNNISGGRSGNKLPTNKVDFMRAFNADLQKQNDNMEGNL